MNKIRRQVECAMEPRQWVRSEFESDNTIRRLAAQVLVLEKACRYHRASWNLSVEAQRHISFMDSCHDLQLLRRKKLRHIALSCGQKSRHCYGIAVGLYDRAKKI